MLDATPPLSLPFLRSKRGAPARGFPDLKGLLAVGAASLAYLLWLLLDRSKPGTRTLVSDVMGPAAALAGFVWSLWRVRAPDGSRVGLFEPGWRRSLAPCLVSLGMAAYVVGDGLWFYYEQVRHRSPFPSWADLGYVLSSVFLVAGVLLLPRRRAPLVLRVRILLDALMTMASIVTFSWFFTLGPTILAAEGGALEKALTAAYPLLDLGILFCVLMMSGGDAEEGSKGARSLLSWGMLLFAAADVVFAYMSLKGTYTVGAVDSGWFAANLLIGFGAYRLRQGAMGAPAEAAGDLGAKPVLWRSLLPYALIPAVAGLVVHVWRGGATGPLANGVYIGSGVLMALVLVRQVFALVENSRLYSYLQAAYRELEALATTDGMTGLWNHRTFQERFRAELAMSRETGEPVSLLLIDVDRFKSYNDAFGHPAGDGALRLVAQVLKSGVRPRDLPARYGGEEFAAVLPATGEGEALALAEEIRAACAAQEFPCRAVTLSIGVVSAVGGDADRMIEAADRALYAAKHRGRNRVVAGSEPGLDEVGLTPDESHAPFVDAVTGPAVP